MTYRNKVLKDKIEVSVLLRCVKIF